MNAVCGTSCSSSGDRYEKALRIHQVREQLAEASSSGATAIPAPALLIPLYSFISLVFKRMHQSNAEIRFQVL